MTFHPINLIDNPFTMMFMLNEYCTYACTCVAGTIDTSLLRLLFYANTVLIEPARVLQANIKIDHTIQEAGEGILLLGQYIHFGFGDTGFQEAVNVCPESWLIVSQHRQL